MKGGAPAIRRAFEQSEQVTLERQPRMAQSMTEQELDEILTFRWPMVLRRTMRDSSDDWLKGFVRSIAMHGKRKNWRPSPKQEQIMRRLVSELGTAPDASFDPIES